MKKCRFLSIKIMVLALLVNVAAMSSALEIPKVDPSIKNELKSVPFERRLKKSFQDIKTTMIMSSPVFTIEVNSGMSFERVFKSLSQDNLARSATIEIKSLWVSRGSTANADPKPNVDLMKCLKTKKFIIETDKNGVFTKTEGIDKARAEIAACKSSDEDKRAMKAFMGDSMFYALVDIKDGKDLDTLGSDKTRKIGDKWKAKVNFSGKSVEVGFELLGWRVENGAPLAVVLQKIPVQTTTTPSKTPGAKPVNSEQKTESYYLLSEDRLDSGIVLDVISNTVPKDGSQSIKITTVIQSKTKLL